MHQALRNGNRAVFLLLVGVGACPCRADTVVYNSFTQSTTVPALQVIADPDETNSRVELPGLPSDREFDSQVGDSITLAGTARFVSGFAVRIGAWAGAGSAPLTTDLELNIYTNSAGLPGSLLWSGTLTGIVLVADRAYDATFAPNVTVPTSLVFSIAMPNISNDGHRLMGAVPSGVVLTGFSGPDTVRQDTVTQAWRSEVFGVQFANLQARVTAIPAPGALFLAGVPLVVMNRRRRSAEG